MSKKARTYATARNSDGFVSQGRVALSDSQAKYLRIFTVEHMTNLKYVAHREKCSVQNVRKMRRKLIQLGYMDARYNAVSFSGFSSQPPRRDYGQNWCLNGLEYNVKVIGGQYGESYLEAGNAAFPLKGSSVQFCEDSIKIKVGQVFEADHPNKAAWTASEYVFSLLRSLEAKYPGLLLLKEGYSNVRRVKGEFARMNDTIALQEGAAQLTVHSGEDGKLRVKVDWSPGTMPEIEFMHSKHAQPDANKYEDFLRDMVERNHLKLSELSAMVYETQKQHHMIAQEVGQLTTALRLFVESQRSVKAPEPVVEPYDPKVVNYFG